MRALMDRIPTGKAEVFAFPIQWDHYNVHLMSEKFKASRRERGRRWARCAIGAAAGLQPREGCRHAKHLGPLLRLRPPTPPHSLTADSSNTCDAPSSSSQGWVSSKVEALLGVPVSAARGLQGRPAGAPWCSPCRAALPG
jgi:hypothetical protein